MSFSLPSYIFLSKCSVCCPSLPLHFLHLSSAPPACTILWDLTLLTIIPLKHLGAGGYITANVIVIISECSLIPGIADTKVCGRLIAL